MSHEQHQGGPNSRAQRPMFDQDAQSGSAHAKVHSTGAQRTRPPQVQNRTTYSSGQSGAKRTYTSAARGTSQSPRAAVYGGGTGRAARRSAAAKPKKGWRRAGVVALTLVLVLVVGIVSVYSYVAHKLNAGADPLPEEVQTLPEYTGKGIINFLVCGLDYDNEGADGYSSDEKIGRTDMILYVHYDTTAQKMSILQLPRDTFVGEGVETGGTGKINGLYFFAPDENNRMGALASVLKNQFQLPVDFYVTVDMDALKELIAIKGTIDVYVPVEVSDPEHPEAVIPVGWRAFTPDEAEFFLRNRHSPTYHEQGDIMRLQMQQSFYSALFREFKSLSGSDLVMWMRVLLAYVKTDAAPLELGGLAQKALSLEGDNLTFVRPPCGESIYGTRSLITLDEEQTADLLNQYFRPEGETYTAAQLDIQELPRNNGTVEASIRSMATIQASEPPKDEPS